MEEKNQKEELLRDLQLIREAAKKNNSILKYISFSEGIKNAALWSGVAIIVICLGLLMLENHYGSFRDIPGTIKAITFATIGFISVVLSWLKISGVNRVVKRAKKDMNILLLIKDVYAGLLVIIIPFMVSIGVLSVYLCVSGFSRLIVPVLAILISLMMISLIVILNQKDLLLSLEWIFISGTVSLFISDAVNPLLLLIFTFGLGMLILYGAARRSISRGKRD